MKKVLALLLALVLVLSLAACGGGEKSEETSNKSIITVSQLTNELKTVHSDLNFSKNGNDYSWSGKVALDDDIATIKVKADESDNVLSVSITDKGMYNKALSSWDSVSKLMNQVNEDSGKCSIGEIVAATCVAQLIALYDAAASGDSNAGKSEMLEQVFTSGNYKVDGWEIILKMNESSDIIDIDLK